MAASVLILGLTLIALVPNSSRPTSASSTQPVVFAYGTLIGGAGSWLGIEPPAVEIPTLLNSRATYIRVADASTCVIGAGIPDSTTKPYLQQLKNAGIHLGVVIFLQNDCGTSVYIGQAQALLNSGWYDWIFLDGALLDPSLQQIVNALRQQGWTKITENDSRFGTISQVVVPATGVWGHFSAFCLLSTTGYCGSTFTWPPTILNGDISFINYVYTHYPNSIAVEEVEVPPETTILSGYSTATQESLLGSWAQQQTTYGYTMLYPFFTDSAGGYDCQASATCAYETNLIAQYNSLPTATLTHSSIATTATTTTTMTSTTAMVHSTITLKSTFTSATLPTVSQTTSTTTITTGSVAGTTTNTLTAMLTQSTATTQTTLSTGTTIRQSGITTVSTSYTTTTGTTVSFTASTGTSAVTETQTVTVIDTLIGIIQQLRQFVHEFLQLIGIKSVFTPVSRQINQIIITKQPLTVTQTAPADGALEPPNTSIVLSVTVTSGGSPVQNANVSFVVNGSTVCTVHSNSSGVASCPFTTGSASHTYSWYANATKPGYVPATSATETFHT